jgi:uncharacterized membrane protein
MKIFVCCLGFALAVMVMPACAAPPTTVLINESALRQQYPQEIASLLESVKGFAKAHDGDVIDVGADVTPVGVKSRLVRHSRRPARLVIFGDESGIPRFKVHAGNLSLETDYFYGDLDGDGLAEVAVARVLGNPRAMMRQLGGSTPAGGHRALLLTLASPLQHMEMNRFASTLSDLGYNIEVRDHRDLQALAEADLIMLEGHGDPNGWYGGKDGTYVTAGNVPELPKHPVIFAGACSTAGPGAPILRTFLEKGCLAYIGSASPSYGWTPADLGNELSLHLMDALAAHPQWTVAELIAEARNRYIRGNRLESLMLRLEKGESPKIDTRQVSTALQYQVFGDITATFPRGAGSPLFKTQPLTGKPVSISAGTSIPVRFSIGPDQGSPELFFHAEWDDSVTAGLELEIVQNGKILHSVDWRRQREWWEFVFFTSGGYRNNGRYHAYGLFPLIRQDGTNEVKVVLKRASKPILLKADSMVQIWSAQWPVVLSPRSLSRILDVFAAESAWLGRLGGYDKDPGANSPRQQDHLGWAANQPIERVAKNLMGKYDLQFDRQMRMSKDAGQRFYGEASARLAGYGIDLGDPGANGRMAGSHYEWAKKQTPEKLRGGIDDKVRRVMAGAAIDR